MKSGFFEKLPEDQEGERQRACFLTGVAHDWNVTILLGLQDLALISWRNWHLPKLVPLRRYRLCHKVMPEAHIWQVEHQIPPYNLHWCAVYRVQLTLNDWDQPLLTVKSASAVHQVTPLTVEALNTTLAQTSKEPPLLLPQHGYG